MPKNDDVAYAKLEPQQGHGLMRFAWWGAAVLALVLGYADLARGGESLAPVLLVLGYCVCIPMAILK